MQKYSEPKFKVGDIVEVVSGTVSTKGYLDLRHCFDLRHYFEIGTVGRITKVWLGESIEYNVASDAHDFEQMIPEIDLKAADC